MRAFEDFTVGETIDHGSRRVSADEMIAYAREFDPEPAHLDGGGMADGVVASGWHIAAIFMRLLADSMLLDSTCMGAPGVDRLIWSTTLRPDETLTARSTVLSARISRSRPEMGLVHFRHEALDSRGAVVMTLENAIMFGLRTGGAE